MKNLFPGYYKKTDSDIKRIWENGIIVFDANVLLNLYRYSDSTQGAILKLIKKIAKQIYLPHQAALEYNRNRYEVIAEQEKTYKEFLDKILQIQKDLQSTSKPPFLSSQIDQELNIVLEKVNAEVNDSINKYCQYLIIDPIYNTISELFNGRITKSFSEDELNKIYKEGEERFKNKIPPGFEDEKNKEGNRKYGDLVLWKQIILTAMELKKDVILITDERKIDWWWKIKDGKNMGPRHELVEEIKLQAKVDFHMYSSERFLHYGQFFLNEKINQQALEEIKAMKKAELEEINKSKYEHQRFEQGKSVNDEIFYIINRVDDIDKILSYLRNQQEIYLNDTIESNEKKANLHNIKLHETELTEERMQLKNRLDYIENFIDESEISNSQKLRFVKYYNFLKNKGIK